MMRNERTSRTGGPTNEALAGTLLTTKLLVHADEAIFCNLPATLDDLMRPGLMQLNRDETAVEMFFRERGEAEALITALAALDPPVAADIVGEVAMPIGQPCGER